MGRVPTNLLLLYHHSNPLHSTTNSKKMHEHVLEFAHGESSGIEVATRIEYTSSTKLSDPTAPLCTVVTVEIVRLDKDDRSHERPPNSSLEHHDSPNTHEACHVMPK